MIFCYVWRRLIRSFNHCIFWPRHWSRHEWRGMNNRQYLLFPHFILSSNAWFSSPCSPTLLFLALELVLFHKPQYFVSVLCSRSTLPHCQWWYYTVNQKNTPKCFLIYSRQNLTDCDNIWYILSWVNLSYRNVNAFHLTWIVSQPYLVKLNICVLQVNSS